MKPSMPMNEFQRRPCEADPDAKKSVVSTSYLRPALVLFFKPEIRAWRGERSLKTVFWGYGVLGTIGVGALYFLADHAMLRQILLVLIVGYMVWLLVSIWRSSSALDRIWNVFARLLVVAWTGNTTMLVLFLEIDLIRSCLGY